MISLASWAEKPVYVSLRIDWKTLGLNRKKAVISVPFVEDFQEAMQLLGKNNPEVMRDFRRFMDSVLKEGYLDVKTKELIALGMAITARCRYCIGIHVEKCLSAGAKKEEILEAATVAILMGGGPALTYIAEVKKALEEFA